MKTRRIYLFVAACLAGVVLTAQEITFPPLPGFRLQTNYPVYNPDDLWNFINGAADTYLSFNFQDLRVAEYKKGKEVIKLEIYRHSDNNMAFGIYASERSPSFEFKNLGSQGYVADGSINFFKGNYYVKIKTWSKKEKTRLAAESLAARIDGQITGVGAMPAMLAKFPEKGKKPNEETFINENVLGHTFLSKAFKANYQQGSDNFSVYVITERSADSALATLSRYVASTGIDPMNTGEGKFILNDGYNGTIFVAGKGDRIVIISGLAKDQSEIADEYASSILEQ